MWKHFTTGVLTFTKTPLSPLTASVLHSKTQWETATKAQKEALEKHHWRCSVQLQKDDIQCMQSLNSHRQKKQQTRVCVSVILAKSLFTCAFLHHYLSVLTVSALCVCRYVERKNFLERVDHRQFELEKSVRLNNMKRWQEERADTFTDQNIDCPIFTHTLHTLCFLCHIGGITCSPPKQKLVCFHNLNVQLPYCLFLLPLFLCPILHVHFYQGFFNMKEEQLKNCSPQGLQPIPQKPHFIIHRGTS